MSTLSLAALMSASAIILAGEVHAEVLKVALTRSAVNVAGYIAHDEGLFEKYGLEVEIVLTASGAEANELLAAGRVDAATLGLGPTAVAWANGFKFWPIAKYGDGGDVYSVMARVDSGIEDVSQLVGKRVAVVKGTDPETALILNMESVGADFKDVQVLDSPWSDHASLLLRGDVDAANTNEPFTSIILRDFSDSIHLVTRLGDTYGNGGFVVVSDEVFNSENAKGLALAYWEAHSRIRHDPSMAADTLVKWLGIDRDIAQSSLEKFIANPIFGERTVSDLEDNFRILSKANRIRSIPDYKVIVDAGLNFQQTLVDDQNYSSLLSGLDTK